jgi:hypothetical protein
MSVRTGRLGKRETMNGVQVRQDAAERDVDVRFATQVSNLGSIADDAVTDLIRAEAGIARAADSAALLRIAELIRATVEHGRDADELWRRNVLDDTLRRLTPAETPVPLAPVSEGGSAYLANAMIMLDKALGESADVNDLHLARVFLANLANVTLAEANRALHTRSSAVTWLAR